MRKDGQAMSQRVDHLARIEQYVDKVEDWDQLPNEPLVSVCITTYNHETFIGEAIEGVLMQETDFAYEIILAEDNSTDRTRKIVLEYQARHPEKIRLRLARENLYRRNIRYPGLGARSSARGRYVALCEGDDYWTDSNKLQKQVQLLDKYPDCAICFTGCRTLDERDRKFGRILQPKHSRSFYSLEYLLKANPFATCTVMYRNGLVESLPPWFFEGPGGSYYLRVLYAMKGRIGYINKVCAVYRVHEGGVHSTLDTLEKYDQAVQVREPILQELDEYHRAVLVSTIYSINRKALREAMRREDAAQVRKYARRCWKLVRYSQRKFLDVPLLLVLEMYSPLLKSILASLRDLKSWLTTGFRYIK